MIKIDITYDIIINVKDINKIPYRSSGIYVFLDKENKPLYVGLAAELRTRLTDHLNKRTNTKRYSHLFKKVALISESDSLSRRIAETYLINVLNTPLNKSNVYPDGLKAQSVGGTSWYDNTIGQCQGITNEGKRCLRPGHTNGFCNLHGGNGISLTKIMQEAAKKAAQEAKEQALTLPEPPSPPP